jgi:vancomycin resistance protein VanJ
MSPIRAAGWLRNALLLPAGAGLLVRFTVQDRISWLDVSYYALPLPVIAGLLLVAGVLSLGPGPKSPSLACFAVSGGLVFLWMTTGVAWNRCAAERPDFKVLEWNTAHGGTGWPGIATAIRRQNAALVALVEADAHLPGTERFWKEQFPEYSVRAPGGGLVLLIKGDILRIELQQFGEKSRLALAETSLGGKPLRVVMVDLEANPLSRRKLLLERVEEVAAIPFAGPTLVIGDFNTPGDSVWFKGLRRNYSEALEEAGTGLLATWPVPIPLLGLDHIWVSKDLVPMCSGKRSGWRSDHAQVWSKLSFVKPAHPPAVADGPGPPRPAPH